MLVLVPFECTAQAGYDVAYLPWDQTMCSTKVVTSFELQETPIGEGHKHVFFRCRGQIPVYRNGQMLTVII